MQTYSFTDSENLSATELHLLRERAENKPLFDEAVAYMKRMNFRADIARGCTRNKDGIVAQFVNYDWAQEYADYPHFVFHDFFRGHLLNKYSRLVRGLDKS